MYDRRDKNTNSQTNSLIKYIYQTHIEWMRNEMKCITSR